MKELTFENTLETYVSEQKKWEKERDAVPDGIFKDALTTLIQRNQIVIDALTKQIPKPTFQCRCSVCGLELAECDWGDESGLLSDDENGFIYCPHCGQRFDPKRDDLYDKTERKEEWNGDEPLLVP